jgi:RimJ/RimL family protein N-acetyltransferase
LRLDRETRPASDPRFEPAYPLETERLRLRRFNADDLHALHAIHSNPDVARYLSGEPRSLDEVRDVLERKIAGASIAGEGEWLSVAVTLRTSSTLIGDCVLQWSSEEHRQGEIGFLFDPAFQGRGYAT